MLISDSVAVTEMSPLNRPGFSLHHCLPLIDWLGCFYQVKPGRILLDDDLIRLVRKFSLDMIDPAEIIVLDRMIFPACANIKTKLCSCNSQSPIATTFRTAVDEALAAITPKTKIILVRNSASPFDGTISRSELQRLFLSLPEHTLLVVDQTNRHLPGGSIAVSELPYLPEHPAGKILKVYTKATGFAGSIRISIDRHETNVLALTDFLIARNVIAHSMVQ